MKEVIEDIVEDVYGYGNIYALNDELKTKIQKALRNVVDKIAFLTELKATNELVYKGHNNTCENEKCVNDSLFEASNEIIDVLVLEYTTEG